MKTYHNPQVLHHIVFVSEHSSTMEQGSVSELSTNQTACSGKSILTSVHHNTVPAVLIFQDPQCVFIVYFAGDIFHML